MQSGVTYDSNEWTVTVTVPEDLSAPTVSYSSKNDGRANNEGAEFINTYAATGTYTPAVKKVLNGRDLKSGRVQLHDHGSG